MACLIGTHFKMYCHICCSAWRLYIGDKSQYLRFLHFYRLSVTVIYPPDYTCILILYLPAVFIFRKNLNKRMVVSKLLTSDLLMVRGYS